SDVLCSLCDQRRCREWAGRSLHRESREGRRPDDRRPPRLLSRRDSRSLIERSDLELVERVLSRGDESAFRELYGRHSKALYRLPVRLLGGGDSDAGDVLQETWCRAFEGLRRFHGGSSVRTWLAGVVVNCAREHIRARAQSRNLPSAGLARPTAG